MTTLTLAALAVWHGDQADVWQKEELKYTGLLNAQPAGSITWHNLYDQAHAAAHSQLFHAQAMELLRQHIQPDEA